MKELIAHWFDPHECVLHVTVTGDILRSNAEDFRRGVFGLLGAREDLADDWQIFRLDLTGVGKVDATGFDVVFLLLREIQGQDRKLQVLVSCPEIHRAFVFSRLDQQVDLRFV